MSTLVDNVRTATYRDGFIILVTQSGVEMRFPIAENSRLVNGTPARLNHIKISPFGLHWPDLDEDLSIRGILDGDYGQTTKKSTP